MTEHALVEPDDPASEVKRTQNGEAEDPNITDTAGYTLPAALTPAVLRHFLSAAEQVEKARN